MNNTRRKNLNGVIYRLEMAREILDALYNEEEEYRDNIPENLQNSERYERADEAVDALCDALYNLDEAIENISTAIDC